MKINIKIAGMLSLLFLSGFILYLSINIEDKQSYRISSIEIKGGNFISDKDYASFAMLNDTTAYPFLTPAVIKDRIERHPYVAKADVKRDGLRNIAVQIEEKKFYAILLDAGVQVLLTENMQVVPFMPQSTGVNFPVISNAENIEAVKKLSYAGNNGDIVTAFKIMDAFRLTNDELSANLSQIDMRNGKDILVYFSNIDFPVIFGRNEEIKKAAYFGSLWKFMKGNEVKNYLDYVDLRFDKHVFLGVTEEESGNEGKQI